MTRLHAIPDITHFEPRLNLSTDEAPKRKRHWTPWYRLPIPPFCPNGHGPLLANGTREFNDGLVIQYRKCHHPGCQEKAVTTYHRTAEIAVDAKVVR